MKKGVSPIIAAVILIAITAALAFIIFSSGKDFLTQLSPAPYCERVAFEAGIYNQDRDYFLEVENTGNEEIEGFQIHIKDESAGKIEVQAISMKISPGGSLSQEVDISYAAENEIYIIPIIKNTEGEPKPCETALGKKISISYPEAS